MRACGYCFATDATERPQCKHEAKMIFPSSSARRRVSVQHMPTAAAGPPPCAAIG
ncbi:hypothetical protein BSLA_02f3354 [Burkholderia stabilis]|nr:hypothetical protein BSLA_02f3354 [Burkholderia stabilis]